MIPKDTFKGKQVYIYARVSTKKQRKALPVQVNEVKAQLKKLGYKGEPIVYSEQKSGTTIERPKLKKMMIDIEQSKKPAVVVVRDIQRLARNTRLYGYLTYPWIDKNIPIVALQENLVTTTNSVPSPQGELLAGIFISAGGQEVDTRKKQTATGTKAAREAGIISGTPTNLYPNDPINPVRELVVLMDQGISQAEVSRRLGRSKSWAKDLKNKVKEIREKGNETILQEWLDVGDMVREMEQKHGPRSGKLASPQMKAVGRKTSGYFKIPWEFPKPSEEDLDEYFVNYKKYLSKSVR